MNNLALHFLSESPWQVKDLREQRLKLILQLQEMGFKFKLVLADSLYGESDCNFISSGGKWL
jgi:hypothetical protein